MSLRFNETSLRQLKIFRAVVENGGFSAAQAALNTSAATISVQMKELEYQLGMTLCQRGRMGFKLTEQGQSVYDATGNLYSSFENFNLGIANLREELVGELRLGLQYNSATNMNFKLPQAIALFNRRKNNVIFNIEEAKTSKQETRTLDGYYNLSIGLFHQRISGLDYKKICTEEIGLYCAQNHPLFDVTNDDLIREKLPDCKLVCSSSKQGMLPQNEYFTGGLSAITENIDAMMLMMLSGCYVGFVPSHFAKSWVDTGKLKQLLPEELVSPVDLHMITKTGLHQPNVVAYFIKDLIECHSVV